MSKEAMKLALEVLESVQQYMKTSEWYDGAITALQEALAEQPAQPQQEPYEIDWPDYHEQAMGCGLEDRGEHCRYGAMRYGWDCAIEAVAQALPDAIYTSPPTLSLAQRTWVGLTEVEADKIYKDGSTFGEMMRMVEAKLKEKNT